MSYDTLVNLLSGASGAVPLAIVLWLKIKTDIERLHCKLNDIERRIDAMKGNP